VWDVRHGLLVAVNGEHFGRLLSIVWSTADEDIVFTGSDDHTVHAWHISQHRWNEGELGRLVTVACLCTAPDKMCFLYGEAKFLFFLRVH